MSFGFGVGDFLAVLELANKVRQKWKDAPEEYSTMKDETKNVSVLLENVHKLSQQATLSNEYIAQINDSSTNCRKVLQRCEALADKYISSTIGQSSLKSKWKRLHLDPDDVRAIRDQLVSCVSGLNALLTTIQSFQVDKISTGVTSIRDREARNSFNTVADWYSSDDFGKHQDYYLSLRLQGTGQWAIGDAKYKQWHDGENTTLLCPGIPGSGKSILHATLVNDLRTRHERDENVLVIYFYCSFQRQSEQTTRNILSVLVRQMFQEHLQLPGDVKALYEKHCNRKTSPSIDELEQLLQSLIQSYQKVFLLMDAMDECMSDESQCTEFLDKIFGLQQQQTPLNLLVTTRWLPRIIEHFGTCPQLEIKAHQEDIERYLDHNIPRLPLKPHVKIKVDDTTLTIRDAVKSRIVAGADGMFLLARLQFDSLTDKTNPRKLQQALLQLKSGSGALQSEYDKALLRIDQQREGFRELAYKVLTWIVFARRELSIKELQEATAVYEGMEDIDHDTDLDEVEQLASVCAGLVRIDHDAEVVRLVHYTTQEYLKSELPKRDEGEVLIARDCLTYLSMSVLKASLPEQNKPAKDQLQKYRLFWYAMEHWGKHVTPQIEQGLVAHIDGLLFSSELFETASRFLVPGSPFASGGSEQTYRSKISPAHVCAFFGMTSTMLRIIEKGEGYDGFDSIAQTPLTWAAQYGHTEIVRLLLEQSRAVVESRDTWGRTPLSIATDKGNLEVVKVLLSRADVNKYDLPPSERQYMTPLHIAVLTGRTDMVTLLLQQKGVKAYTRSYEGKEILKEAIWRGHVDVLKLLLDRSELFFDPSACGLKTMATRNSNEFEVLSLATRCESSEALKVLMEHPGIRDDPSAFSELELLQDAAWYGRPENVDYLLSSNNADPNAKDTDGDTLLYQAVLSRQVGMVKNFLKHPKVDPELSGHEGRTPISRAAENGSFEIVEALLQRHEVNPDRPDKSGRTPLSYAAGCGSVKILKALLQRPGVNPDARDQSGRTPLSYATECGSVDTIRELLVLPTIDMYGKDDSGLTPFLWAVKNSELDVARLFLSRWYTRSDSAKTYSNLVQQAAQDMCRVYKDVCSTNRYSILNILGHCLLFLGYRESARIAFQQQVTIEESGLLPDIQSVSCNGCAMQFLKGERLVCGTCADVDLCRACKEKYTNGEMLAGCKNHEFLEVAREERKSEGTQEVDRITEPVQGPVPFLQHDPDTSPASDSAASAKWRVPVEERFREWGVCFETRAGDLN